MSTLRISVETPASGYTVLVGNGEFSRLGSHCQEAGMAGRCAIITDSTVGPLYAEAAGQSLRAAGYDVVTLTVPAGEASKSLARVEELCGAMTRAGIDRKGWVLALGGGVVGDLAGFVAAIHYRGIPFVQVPTTIVSQVDSSVGGKTGVNLVEGKNLVGAFHQPSLVVIDPQCLQTLESRILREGFGEVIKHAVIRDAAMLGELRELADRIPHTDPADGSRLLAADVLDELAGLVARNIRIKAEIVGADPYETLDLRALLNFGHTVGHAIEAAVPYGKLLHGECVALGMVQALEMSVARAGLPAEERDRVVDVIRAFGLPLACRPEDGLQGEAGVELVKSRLATDKKFEAGALRFVLTRQLGSAYVDKSVTGEEAEAAIRRALGC